MNSAYRYKCKRQDFIFPFFYKIKNDLQQQQRPRLPHAYPTTIGILSTAHPHQPSRVSSISIRLSRSHGSLEHAHTKSHNSLHPNTSSLCTSHAKRTATRAICFVHSRWVVQVFEGVCAVSGWVWTISYRDITIPNEVYIGYGSQNRGWRTVFRHHHRSPPRPSTKRCATTTSFLAKHFDIDSFVLEGNRRKGPLSKDVV